MRRAARAALLLASTSLVAVPASACDPSRFGERAGAGCERSADGCLPASLPPELRGIVRGAVLESVGLAVNDGRATWRALDLDRGEAIVVERYAGRKLAQAPTALKPGAGSLRSEGEGPARIVDHVRRVALSAKDRDALACLADEAAAGEPAVRATTDFAARFVLLLPARVHARSAIGRFEGAPARFERRVDGLLRR